MNPDIKLAIKAEKKAKENLQNYKLSRYGSLSLPSQAISRLINETNKKSAVSKLEEYMSSRSTKSCSNVLQQINSMEIAAKEILDSQFGSNLNEQINNHENYSNEKLMNRRSLKNYEGDNKVHKEIVKKEVE